MEINELTKATIGAAIEVHRSLGPGLLESTYEECLCRELHLRHVPFERQVELPLVYKDMALDCGYRIDVSGRGPSGRGVEGRRYAPASA